MIQKQGVRLVSNKIFYIQVACEWKPKDGTYTMEVFANTEEEALQEVQHVSEYFDFDEQPDSTEVITIWEKEA